MKATIVGASSLLFASAASALIHSGPNELNLTTTAGITYDSNLVGGVNGGDDTFVNFAPQLDFARSAGLIQLQSGAGVNFIRYFDQTSLNSEDLNGNVRLNLSEPLGGSFTGSLSLSYVESASVLEEINARIHSDTFTADASGLLKIGRRMDLSASGTYSKAQRSGGGDTQSLGSNWRWSLSDFLRSTSLRLSYAFLSTQSHDGLTPGSVDIKQTSHQFTAGLARPLFPTGETTISADVGYNFLERSEAEKRAGASGDGGYVFNVGIDGPFLPKKHFPKLRSKLNLSYSKSVAPGLNDDGGRSLQGQASLDWEARESTTVGVAISQARTLTVNNLTVSRTSVDLHATQKLRYNLSGNATTTYSWSTYPGISRNDETFSAATGLSYAFARVWNSNLNYEYRAVASSQTITDFSHHLVSFNVSCRF